MVKYGYIKGHDLRINALSFSPNGDYLASGGEGRIINIWNLETSQIEIDIKYDEVINSLCFSPDGKWLVAGGENNIITLYKVKGISGSKKIPAFVMEAEPDHTPGEKYAVIIRDWRIDMSDKEQLKEIIREVVREILMEKWKDGVDVKSTGEHADKTIAQLKKEIEALKGKPGNKEKMGELLFALRAKQGWKKGKGATGL